MQQGKLFGRHWAGSEVGIGDYVAVEYDRVQLHGGPEGASVVSRIGRS